MTRSRGRILVIRGGAIGDFILTLPALAALRQQFPETHLEVLGYPHIVQLAVAGGVVDAVRSIEARPLAGFFARDGILAEDWRAYFSDFDMVLSYLYDPDRIFQANVARCSQAQFIAGPHRPDESQPRHATEVFLQPLEHVAIFDADPVPRLVLPVPPPGPPLLALHPGSGSERKNWPETNWANLLTGLVASTTRPLLLIGGEAEGDRLDRLAALVPAERLRLARHLPLAQLAEQMHGCAAFLGHDSGITHLAAALDLCTGVLWGESLAAVWQPRGTRVRLLRGGAGLRGITVDQAAALLADMLATDLSPGPMAAGIPGNIA